MQLVRRHARRRSDCCERRGRLLRSTRHPRNWRNAKTCSRLQKTCMAQQPSLAQAAATVGKRFHVGSEGLGLGNRYRTSPPGPHWGKLEGATLPRWPGLGKTVSNGNGLRTDLLNDISRSAVQAPDSSNFPSEGRRGAPLDLRPHSAVLWPRQARTARWTGAYSRSTRRRPAECSAFPSSQWSDPPSPCWAAGEETARRRSPRRPPRRSRSAAGPPPRCTWAGSRRRAAIRSGCPRTAAWLLRGLPRWRGALASCSFARGPKARALHGALRIAETVALQAPQSAHAAYLVESSRLSATHLGPRARRWTDPEPSASPPTNAWGFPRKRRRSRRPLWRGSPAKLATAGRRAD